MTTSSKPLFNYKFENIPEELRKLKQWVLFRMVWDDKRQKWTKVPFQNNGQNASSTNPSTWITFDDAKFAFDLVGDFDGIGFVFTENDPYCGIDLDHCVNSETKLIELWADKWLRKFSQAYIEFSPSGTGLHIITKAKLPGAGKRKSGIEVYDQARYFTITGNRRGNLPGEIENQQNIVEELLLAVSDNDSEATATGTLQGKEWSEEEIQEIIKKGKAAKNGEKFTKLFEGKWEELQYPSQSEADMAFCGLLAFWTGCNETAINQIFVESGLYRNKWDRPDIKSSTIRKAIAFYQNNKTKDDFGAVPKIENKDKTSAAVEPLPVIHFNDVESKNVEYLIQDLLLKNSVSFISGLPGTSKSWMAEEVAVCIGSGAKVFDSFQAQKGKVILFNAEDDPSTITKQRLVGLAHSKGLQPKQLDLHLINVLSLYIDDPETQMQMEETIKLHKPALIILDPFRNIHTQDENDATEISTVLNFLRFLNKTYQCSILLVCHDKKPSKGDSSHRPSQTRGSNALHGWRDSAIYLDAIQDQEGVAKVTLYHRGAPAIEAFCFQLIVENVSIEGSNAKQIKSASLTLVSQHEILSRSESSFETEVLNIIKEHGPLDRGAVKNKIHRGKQKVLKAVRSLILSGQIEEVQMPGSRAKVLRFRNHSEPELATSGSGSTPYKGGTRTLQNGDTEKALIL